MIAQFKTVEYIVFSIKFHAAYIPSVFNGLHLWLMLPWKPEWKQGLHSPKYLYLKDFGSVVLIIRYEYGKKIATRIFRKTTRTTVLLGSKQQLVVPGPHLISEPMELLFCAKTKARVRLQNLQNPCPNMIMPQYKSNGQLTQPLYNTVGSGKNSVCSWMMLGSEIFFFCVYSNSA